MSRYSKFQRRIRLAALTVAASLIGLLASSGLAGAASSQDQPEIPEEVLAALTSDAPPSKMMRIEYRGNQLFFDEMGPADAPGRTTVNAWIRLPGGEIRRRGVMSDEDGRFTMVIDTTDLPEDSRIFLDQWSSPLIFVKEHIQLDPVYGGEYVPKKTGGVDPPPCLECVDEGSADMFNGGCEARHSGVNLVDGALPTSLPLFSFDTGSLGIDFKIHHQSQKVLNGEMGQSASHSFNAAIVQTGEETAYFKTSNLELHPFSGESFFFSIGKNWTAPEGFFSNLRKDDLLNRWILTTRNGAELQFIAGAMDQPGSLISIRDRNGNTTRINRDYSGFVDSVASDLGQDLQFQYNDDGRMSSVTDHLGRTWSFGYDDLGRLRTTTSPATELVDLGPGDEVTDADLEAKLVNKGRTTTYEYEDPNFPLNITRITDPRGAVSVEYTYYADLANAGRVATKTTAGKVVTYAYNPGPEATPAPLPVLDPGNSITRVTDPEGNVTDYEMHGIAGGPLGGAGEYGLRRKVTWTERGKGNEPLREGEPLAWEQRWLHDCDCLRAKKIAQPFRYEEADLWVGVDGQQLEFDPDDRMPLNHPTEVFEYNENGQVTAYKYTLDHHQTSEDGKLCDRNQSTDTICWERTYDTIENFSRELTYTEPRAFDDNPIYDGLEFTHKYYYDAAGNRTRHVAPTVTRGTDGEQQVIEETWTHNDAGQVTSHTDPNGNVTTYTYFDGTATGGDVNTKGQFAGYPESVTRGAVGSADPATNLTTWYRVNALGMVTQMIDAMGFIYDYEYNDLGERTREINAEVTLRNGQKVRYESRYLYDSAGNQVMSRRSNVDLDGTVPVNDFIDRSQSFDEVNNRLTARVEIDENDANDAVTRYAYDNNDQLAVVQQPEGNRTFHLYDERRLRFKTFYGIAPGSEPAEAYPNDKRATDLEGASTVGFTTTTYDARSNVVRARDGRGNFTDHFYDFNNRRVATSDQNGNGTVSGYDDASNQLTQEDGAVSKDTADITEALQRSYRRYDEVGRRYQRVLDIDLESDESDIVDPDDGMNSSYRTQYDPGSRTIRSLDANGNPTLTTYDAANRRQAVTDALGNVGSFFYDDNSNILEVHELEIPGPGAEGDPEFYVTRYVYDELKRRTELHILGLVGSSIDHETSIAYDSRNNTRLVEDAEGNFTVSTYDDLDRILMTQRYDDDPFKTSATELIHYEYAYDRNSRKTHDVAFSTVTDPSKVQVTLYLYDDFNRLTTTVYPDADDFRESSSGEGYARIDLNDPNGEDGIYDRVETNYDENSNPMTVIEQRGVKSANRYDLGNRLDQQVITLPPGVPGAYLQQYDYDSLNRLTEARNNYALVQRDYDSLSRIVAETQSIRLDGSGFTNTWENPIRVCSDYDQQSNRTRMWVVSGLCNDSTASDLDVRYSSYDALNRLEDIDAEYFDQPLHDIAEYTYLGSGRVSSKTYGNGAVLTRTYDEKRRLREHVWRGGTQQGTLVGFRYDYDDVDNPLYEQFLHDQNLYDNYSYNDRYELTGVTYRSPDPVDYRNVEDPVSHSSSFLYDDNFNRREASYGDPFGAEPLIHDVYAFNSANESLSIDRQVDNGSGTPFTPEHDAVGNMTYLSVRPAAGSEAGKDVQLRATWDAFNLLFSATVPDSNLAGGVFKEEYRYDPFRRRIAKFDISDDSCETCPRLAGRRYIHDGLSVVEERVFVKESVSALNTDVAGLLERIYVNGRVIDEPLLAAIDGNGSRKIDPHIPGKNMPGEIDFEYYYLCNRLGSVMGLLDAGSSQQLLELYRYQVYGAATVLSTNRSGNVQGSTGQSERVKKDSSDKGRQTKEEQSNAYVGGSVSSFGNPYSFTSRRLDARTGLLYFRNRYYENGQGRFAGRDPLNYVDHLNLYAYVNGNVTNQLDSLGLASVVAKASLKGEENTALWGLWWGLDTWWLTLEMSCSGDNPNPKCLWPTKGEESTFSGFTVKKDGSIVLDNPSSFIAVLANIVVLPTPKDDDGWYSCRVNFDAHLYWYHTFNIPKVSEEILDKLNAIPGGESIAVALNIAGGVAGFFLPSGSSAKAIWKSLYIEIKACETKGKKVQINFGASGLALNTIIKIPKSQKVGTREFIDEEGGWTISWTD
ncbi:MAG: RHS repeat-associated core domain-containing protein [bacterium]|nr:RHS repeat-associated core domain-containing protein [bacterium]